ncbi:hypothetical protein [Sphingobium nicotianae]|uniref:Uncharacterized protein n=1 Tax=Sphingobium nicotianae TaxID=2782607 RepID=A0A9X1IR09_9SPHN|nr:hypothetical protein [Sphingobium nicotianae]MBT2186989.1 hypothetical protein [Sphingobium nicotianae]
MKVSPRLRETLARYATIEKELEAIGLRTDQERKQALVHWRRQLSEQIGLLSPLIDQDPDLTRNLDMHRELSKRFTAMRYGLALHQASWPAVRIDEDPVAYRASARDVQEKSRLFWQWCGEHLGVNRG